MKTQKYIVLPLYDHVSLAEAEQLAWDVSHQMGLSQDAYVVLGEPPAKEEIAERTLETDLLEDR